MKPEQSKFHKRFKFSLFQRMQEFFNAPYPSVYSFRELGFIAASIGIVTGVLILIFTPYDLDTIQRPYRTLILLGYGLITIPMIFGIGGINLLLNHKFAWDENWRIKNEILLYIIILLCIGFVHYLYNHVLFYDAFEWKALLLNLVYSGLIGVFPVLLLITIDWVMLLKKHQKMALGYNEKAPHVEETDMVGESNPAGDSESKALIILKLEGSGKEERLKIEMQQLLYCKAEGNYVDIVYRNKKDGNVNHQLLRKSLHILESDFIEQGHEVFRCHRSYLVNRNNVKNAEGNARGLTLHLDENHCVPVSRQFVKSF